MKEAVSLLIIFLVLLATVFLKYQFFLHPNSSVYFLSNSDIMSKAPEFLKKPIPMPYVESYIEYPVLTGLWAAFTGSLSTTARDYFLFNGILLSLFSTLNILLSQRIAQMFFGRETSFFKFLTPSVFLFTFFNWDSLALFFLLAAVYSLGKNKTRAGIFLAGLGFWAKVFPIFCLPAVFLNLMRQRKFVLIASALSGLVVISLVLNLPFYLASRDGWGLFFSFSSKRPPNIDSVWSGIYVITDKVFGPGFYYKKYYEVGINYLSFGLMAAVAGASYLLKIRRKLPINVMVETAFLVSVFLLFSKVYSPQYNLWLAPLLVIIGVNYRKILLYEFLNLLLAWAVFQYFWEVFIAGKIILPFPYFKLTYSLAVLRHLSLIWITLDVWKMSLKESNYEESN